MHRTVSASSRCLKPYHWTLQAALPLAAVEDRLEAKKLPVMKPTQPPSALRAAATEKEALEASMQPVTDSLLQRGQGQSFRAEGGQALAGVSSSDCAIGGYQNQNRSTADTYLNLHKSMPLYSLP